MKAIDSMLKHSCHSFCQSYPLLIAGCPTTQVADVLVQNNYNTSFCAGDIFSSPDGVNFTPLGVLNCIEYQSWVPEVSLVA